MPLLHKHILLGLVLVASLILLPLSLGLVLNEASIPSHGTIDYGIDTRVGQFENRTCYLEILFDNGTSQIISKSTDADAVINQAIAMSIGGSVFISYSEKDYRIDAPIIMKDYVTLILDNNVRINQTASRAIVSFEGSSSDHLTNAHIDSFGRAVFIGSGLSGNTGIYMNYAYGCSVKNVEVTNTGLSLIKLKLSDNNTLQNIYAHKYSVAMTANHGIELDSSAYNKLLNCTVDAEDFANSRSCLYIGCNYAKHGMYNEIIGGAYMNSAQDNGIYICSSGLGSVDYTTVKDVRVSGNLDSGHSGFKLRPASHCTVTGLISENNHFGVTLGTHMNPGEAATADSDYNYIQGIIRNNDRVGISLEIDYDGYTISNNKFDIVTEGNGHHGILITTYGRANAEISYNEINVESRNNNMSGIWMEEYGGSRVEGNVIRGIFENNVDYGVHVQGSGSIDNKFDCVIQNNGINVYDRGTRTRINKVGKEAAGAGNSRTPAFWDVDDIVQNTDDGTSWIKNVDGTMTLLTTLKARFATFNSINPLSVLFIDQSYDPNYSIVAWTWTFGDASGSSEQNPQYVYSSFGDYTITLTARNSIDSTDSVTKVISIQS
ncbi:PKD domain-containing protein [Candidatus Bathyarchaeota archaeon]|nr:PKD domain-containing protein [Candidatus Bathyarchaeota archaeon]